MKTYPKDKKRFNKPELEIVEFAAEDIIVTSSESGELGDPNPKDGDINNWW